MIEDEIYEIEKQIANDAYLLKLNLIRTINENREDKNFILFVEKILSWYKDKQEGKQHLWDMFHNCFETQDPYLFLSGLREFISNAILDDGAFEIKWKKIKFSSDHHVIWNSSFVGYEEEISTMDDLETYPVVYRNDDDGTQDPSLLLVAMAEKEIREKKRIQQLLQLEDLFKRK